MSDHTFVIIWVVKIFFVLVYQCLFISGAEEMLNYYEHVISEIQTKGNSIGHMASFFFLKRKKWRKKRMQGKQHKRYLKDISTNQNVWSTLESLLKKKNIGKNPPFMRQLEM